MKDPNAKLTSAEYEQLKTLVQARGLKPAEVAAVLGAGPANRSRREVEQTLTSWLKNLPKG